MLVERHTDFKGLQSDFFIVQDLFSFLTIHLQFTSESRPETGHLGSQNYISLTPLS